MQVPPAQGAAGGEPLPAFEHKIMTIRSGAVGEFLVGEPIPRRWLTDDAKYHARWVADAQPMEGFLFGDPEVWVILEKGPMHDVEPDDVEKLEPVLRPKALAQARAGAKIGAVLVEHPGVSTVASVGVGVGYSMLTAAYRDVEVRRLPEWFDTNITCDARTPKLPGVSFLLLSCEPGKPPGDVNRIFVHAP
ncbi:MAG: hypothetical protein R3B13_12825 [Polyangiaceae bacterium]